jgi:hypothetical protein
VDIGQREHPCSPIETNPTLYVHGTVLWHLYGKATVSIRVRSDPRRHTIRSVSDDLRIRDRASV